MIVRAAVRFVTRRASLLESGLMQEMFLALLGLISVAGQADIDCVGLGQPRLTAGMGIVAIGAIAGCTRMRHLRALNLLGLFVMTGHAERFRVGLCEHDLTVLGGSMADVDRKSTRLNSS